MLTVKQVYDWINERAPFETQMDFDNAGMLVGDPDNQVNGIMAAMDVTSRVLDEAEKNGADLIVTHHPMMFLGRKNMLECDSEGKLLCRMIRSRISLIAAHTNLDQAAGGINDVLAETIGLKGIEGTGYTRAGNLAQPMAGSSFCHVLEDRLNTVVRPYGDMTKEIKRVLVSSGAGSDDWEKMAEFRADVFVTGEMKHHHALAIVESGRLGFECGHFQTEEPGIFALADALQNWVNELKYNVHVTKSAACAYASPECHCR